MREEYVLFESALIKIFVTAIYVLRYTVQVMDKFNFVNLTNLNL